MSYPTIIETFTHIDIYLIDQILKERYQPDELILDAGCGSGRNLRWFYDNSFTCYGVDSDPERIEIAKQSYPLQANNISIALVEELPFAAATFHHIICSAVLHFARSTSHFESMFAELVRVLKPNGSLFIRMTTDIGIEKLIQPISNGIYKLPDETERFLITRALIDRMRTTHHLSLLEPVKTVNVHDLRCMTTLVFKN
jgi:ubiquinone/menaquinone biosynthesis C-methylase UbiE